MRTFAALVVFLIPCITIAQKPYLSNLLATKDSPLYTSYAAAMERSEFILDEGYHFLFYDSTRGAEFVTDNAGDWALAFKMRSRYVYELSEYFRQPVITTSYPDLVRYVSYPFEGIRVDATFFVYSSHIAVQDITVTNETEKKAVVEALPFLRNTHRAFSDVMMIPEKSAMSFTHEEFPDRWMLQHNMPYVETVHDLFMVTPPVDRLGSFRSYTWGSIEIPQEIDRKKPPVYVVWGRIFHNDGERCPHRSPTVTLTAMLNNDRTKLLIENGPRWGSAESNVTANSFYGIELGSLASVKQGDQFTIFIHCEASKQLAVIEGIVEDTSKSRSLRIDARLADDTLPLSPKAIRRDIWGSGTELRLYWEEGPLGTRYNVYRRDYRQGGAYHLLAADLEQTFHTDKNIPDDDIYGYVVTAINSEGRMSIHSSEVNNIEGSDFLTDVKYPGQVKGDARDLVRVVSAAKTLELPPGGSERLRVLRAVRRPSDSQEDLMKQCETLMKEDLEQYVRANETLFSKIPPPPSGESDKMMLYWSAFSLMRQVMLPPEGKCSFNYYVFSREPQWGWGHGGQVFHESLTMMAYGFMDPVSAMNSQRVFRERQHPNGYINYRTGPYLDETIPTNGQLTTSAPWYAWQNWELYKITKDKSFLKEMYESSKRLYKFFIKNRDSDGDGLCEWGGHAVLESVRDGWVAVWDQVGDPSNFEALDLNCMLVQEEKALAAMARELGSAREARAWEKKAAARANAINTIMWDDSTGFYYNVEKKNHSFMFKTWNDLKREEIIGFLPLWAGVADSSRAARLVQKLKDPAKFWRRYGLPTLAADDKYFNAKGYWNGPVWIQWVYLVQRGLLQYGYKAEAHELVNRVAENMISQLKKDHNLWELYSPDEQWAGHNKTYIWAGIIARMMLDVADAK